ncbi:hypothetical protein RRG08_003511 [Elysia crispata]|uniref:Uncharacterized protein n=1 Tax=Elysia crispata TaxID=231223 RepID=A0AAE1CTL8_9GAST|nr:hypothetical protein RRG08_003511 [Elysia crispata]
MRAVRSSGHSGYLQVSVASKHDVRPGTTLSPRPVQLSQAARIMAARYQYLSLNSVIRLVQTGEYCPNIEILIHCERCLTTRRLDLETVLSHNSLVTGTGSRADARARLEKSADLSRWV